MTTTVMEQVQDDTQRYDGARHEPLKYAVSGPGRLNLRTFDNDMRCITTVWREFGAKR